MAATAKLLAETVDKHTSPEVNCRILEDLEFARIAERYNES